jgi:hypothetical protein
MDLNTLWFLLIGVLFTGFFVLEGFDYGVGILLPFLGQDDDERRVIINAIGPFWDGNEVWVIAAGAAMFGAYAAGRAAGGFDSLTDAAKAMAQTKDVTYKPNTQHHATYQKLFAEYRTLHEYFGRGTNDVMKRLREIRNAED